MAKIKNMGTATMRFKEGIIVSGSAANLDNTDSEYSLIVSGSQFIDAKGGGGLSIFKEEPDEAFIKFINSDDVNAWHAEIAFDNAEHIYIHPGRTQDFAVQTRQNTGGSDPRRYAFRIFDNGKAKFEPGQTSQTDARADLPSDVSFFVSGSTDENNIALFGGDTVISGTLLGKNSSLGMGTHDLHIGSKDNFLAFGSSFQFNQNNDNIDSPGDDVFLFMSGAISGKNNGGVALLGGDVVISGSLFAGNSNSASQNLIVNSNISGDFAAVIDNDNSNQGHGLKVTSDGTGTGTNVFEVESVSNTLLRVRGDGRVGIGVTSPSSLLHVNGSATIDTNLHVSGSTSIQDYMIISVSADNTDLQTGTGLVTFRAPFAMSLYQIPRASLSTNGTSQTTVDINVGGTTIMNTNKLTIDANEGTSVSAATSAALTTTNITDDQQITIDVDQAGTGARGLKVTLYYRRNF